MRYRPLIALVVISLSVAACGGGGKNGAGTTGVFDTGAAATGATETTPPLTTTTAVSPPVQIKIPKGQPIGPQSPAEMVAQVQKALIVLGFKIGKPDGVYGAKTRKAVVKFQKQHKLTADGLVGAQTAKAMNKAVAKQSGSG